MRQRTVWLRHVAIAAALLLSSAGAFAQSGGPFDVSWTAFDGGGGVCQGGTFLAAFSAGEPSNGGPLEGGNFGMQGGFLQDRSYFPVPVSLSRFEIE